MNEPKYELDKQGNLIKRNSFLPLPVAEEYLVTATLGYILAIEQLANQTNEDEEYLSYLIGSQVHKQQEKMTNVQKIQYLKDHLNYFNYDQHSNKPKYQIGDRIPGTEIVVCGLMTTSTGMHKYFLQISPDNSLVVDDENIEATLFLLTNNNQPTQR